MVYVLSAIPHKRKKKVLDNVLVVDDFSEEIPDLPLGLVLLSSLR
jgi:hypothetical protein